MSGVDNRVVSMTFDNDSFERKLGDTLKSLDKLSESLKFAGAGKGFSDIADAANAFDPSPMSDAIQSINNKLSALGAVGFAVIQKITESFLDSARQIASIVLNPLLSGGKQRATDIENAKFQFRGLGLDVEAAMESARLAVTGTAFGLDAAAKAAAQFGASGVKVGADMTQALRGIAGAAAMTNTSFAEIADIFTSVAGTGFVNNQDLQRFATRGLNATATLGKQLHKTEAQIKQLASEGKISFATFSKAMDGAFGEHATKANETYTGALANMRAALSRLGASFFAPSMLQQRDLFNTLSPIIDNVHNSLKPLIATLVELKGIGVTNLINFFKGIDLTNFTKSIPNFIDGIKNVFNGISEFTKIVKTAFRDIFPPSSVSIILTISEAFKKLSEKIKMGGETAESVKSIFHGIFSVLAIGIEVVKQVSKLFIDLFSTVADATGLGEGGALSFFADIGEALTALKKSLVDGEGIAKFFIRLGEVIKDPIKFIKELRDSFMEMFNGGDIPGSEGVTTAVNRISQRFETFKELTKKVGDAWRYLGERLEGVRKVLNDVGDYIANWFSELGSKLAAAMQPGDFDAAVDLVNVGLLGGIAIMLKRFFKGGLNFDFGTGIIEKIQGIFDGLTQTLKAMQIEIRAKALMKIALALAVLTASIVVLSLIDSAALTKALVAISVGFGQLVGAMALMEKFSSGSGAAKMIALSTGMILLATAIGILSIAVKNLSSLSLTELAKGLLGVTVMIVGLTAATQLIATDTTGMIRAGFALIGISIALLILSQAVKQFAELSWSEIAKGFVSVAIGLNLIIAAMQLMPKGIVLQAAALILISTALNILALAVKSFAELSWSEMAKGFVAIGAGLVIIAGAMRLMPKGMVLQAAALLILSAALNVMALSIKILATLSLSEMAKGLGALAGMLLILGIAMNVMNGTLAGAAALVIVSGALVILTAVLKTLSKFSLTEIATGLGALAGIFLVLGLGAAALTPVIGTLMGLGVALALVGLGMALFGFGANQVAKAIESIAKHGVETIKILVAALPEIKTAFAKALIGLALELLNAAPLIIKSLKVIVGHLLDTIIELAPRLAKALIVIVTEFLTLVRTLLPELVKTGYAILTNLLRGVRDHIYEVVTLAVEILSNFAQALSDNAQTVVDAGLQIIFAFLTAIANRMVDIVAAGVNLLVSFLGGITDNVVKITTAIIILVNTIIGQVESMYTQIAEAGTNALVRFLGGLTDDVVKIVNAIGDLISAIITAIGDNATKIATAGTDTLISFLDGVKTNSVRTVNKFVEVGLYIVDHFLDAIVFTSDQLGIIMTDFLEGLAASIRANNEGLRNAGISVASAILSGITFGLSDKASGVVGAVTKTGGKVIDGAKKIFGVESPSKVFRKIGHNLMDGLALGISDTTAENSVVKVAESIITNFQNTLSKIPDTLVGMNEFNPVITPVLDLTKVQLASRNLDSLLSISALNPDVSFSKANVISTTAELENTGTETTDTSAPTEITFEQNIYSPTALSVNDIYRNTKSQITLAKEELGIT